jgi:hypothetical protein
LSFPVQGQVEFSEACDIALTKILDLQTVSAQKIIDREKQYPTQSLYCDYLENWKMVIVLMTQNDEALYDKYLDALERRLKRIKEEEDPSNPAYHILVGEIYGHACMAQMMFGDYLSAFQKLVQANKHAQKNLKAHPDYWLNNKLCGIMNISFEKIPTILRWLTNLFGLRGDAKTGFAQMDQYLSDVQDRPGMTSEVLLYYVLALRMSKQEQVGNELLAKYNKPGSPRLALFLQASFLYITGQNEVALSTLASISDDPPEVPFDFYRYLRGKLKLNRLDEDADQDLRFFLEESTFKNYKREICMKLAYYHYIHGDYRKYRQYRDRVETFPKSTTDRDREADVELSRPYDPHTEILKARFLVNGSYFQRAESILVKINPDRLSNQAYRCEYFLLLARVEADAGRHNRSMDLFQKAIRIGLELEDSFAAEAALFAGIEAQNQGKNRTAVKYWNMTLDIKTRDNIYIETFQIRAKNLLEKQKEVNLALH